ncbi:MAG: 5-(carboxyamino)imidazole ribonucleotide mutase [Victivallaceae bacterium]|nr:5-(carboxyamino)imidazole ribonucleotide mutase [Victivallaceae bacterium]
MEQSKQTPQVAIVMGSKSDLPNITSLFKTLKQFDVEFSARVCSAHRTPDDAVTFAKKAKGNGVKIIICVAGMAAHLGGVIAANTTLPIIGLPMSCQPFNGIDALFSTVQMPPGIPVASVTVGPAGAKNAALYAIAILALSDEKLALKLHEYRTEQTLQVYNMNKELQQELKSIF